MTLKSYLKHKGVWPQSGMRDLGRGILLAATVGVVAGLGAIAFQWLCHGVEHVMLDELAGYRPAGPNGEGAIFQPTDTPFRPWMLAVLPMIGGLLGGWVVVTFAPEAEGHGTDAAIDAYHNKRGHIRNRIPLVKMISSALTLGSGGSGGQEGPISQIGAGFGSMLATRFKLSDTERRSLVTAGVGAGLGAIFHAPLAGAIFATEVLYRDPDFESESLIPALISTTVAYNVYSMVFGFERLFLVQPIRFDNPFLLMPLTVLAVVMAAASLGFVKCFYGLHGWFKRWSIPQVLKPGIGGLATGLLAVAMYYAAAPLGVESQKDCLEVLSIGYGYLQKVLDPHGSDLLVGVLLLVGIGKILTMSLTIGSGGSGGVFAPIMVIGGSLGGVIGLLFHQWFPQMAMWTDARVDVFVILGMASFFAAAANTPVSALIIVPEMTGSYTLLLPAMWVCAVAYLIGRGWTIFSEQVGSRTESPAHRGDFVIDVLQGLTVQDAMGQVVKDFICVSLETPLGEIVHMITDTRQTCFPVVDHDGRYYGWFGLNDVRQFLYDSGVGDLAVAQDLASTEGTTLPLQMDLSNAISQFASGDNEELPVVDAENPDKVLGLLRRQDVIAVYSARLLALRQDQPVAAIVA